MKASDILNLPFDARTASTHEIVQRQQAWWWTNEGVKDRDGFLRHMSTLIVHYEREGKYEIVGKLKWARNLGSAYELEIPEQ